MLSIFRWFKRTINAATMGKFLNANFKILLEVVEVGR
jgi:hypothetical protein